jgi:RNA polymerase sigma factor (TIGR02999 family)
MPKKSRICGPADGIVIGGFRGREKTWWLTRFDVYAGQGFQTSRWELEADVALGPLSLSVPPMREMTRILSAIEQGDPVAAEQLLPLVYDELRQLAAQRLAHETPGQTLQATALVHEAYLRLVDVDQAQHWNGRGHFFAAAAEAMRRILVENARRKKRVRHGGEGQKQPLEANEPAIACPVDEIELLTLNDALDHLEATSPRRAQLVKLRYFAGFTLPEVAAMLGISQSTAEADWTYAKAWLKREMEKS